MKTRTILSPWMYRDGRRLDCGPYMSGALEARVILERLSVRKDALRTLTTGHAGGIFNGPQFSRTWVESLEHGVPFLGSSSMLQADLSNLPLLRKKDALSKRLSFLCLEKGMTLISCSGTIGRMVYVRPDMAGMWSSQDIMKVVPDAAKIPPGYLYAYLSSKFGVPLVVGGTYGAIIQHIEPHHIAELPVPRLGEEVEGKVHALVEAAANNLNKYVTLCQSATNRLFEALGFQDLNDCDWHRDRRSLGWTEISMKAESFRALNFEPRARERWRRFESEGCNPLGSLCVPESFKGKIIFKRIDADPEYGVMLLGQRNAFHLHPEGRWIARKSITGLGLQVPAMTTLVPSHGTLGEHELYCRALLVTKRTSNYAFSGDFFRCVPLHEKVRPGYLFAYLRSRSAFRMLRSISAGGKQQEQHPVMMWRFPIPRLDGKGEEAIAALIDEAATRFDSALESEEIARRLVEQTIEEAS